jgi:D-threo-aldose 1-dehydrogenase
MAPRCGAVSQPMKKRRIGSTTLEVAEISFGCGGIGGLYRACSLEDANAVLQAAWQSGVRMFDTAPRYGAGLSERRTGDFIRSHARDEVVLSTKVGRLLRPVPSSAGARNGFVGGLDFDSDYDYSYDGVMRSVEMSYARLGLNRIDILYVHDLGDYTHGKELGAAHFRTFSNGGMKALQKLKSSGVIGGWGLGVNEVKVCLDVMSEADMDCILLAGRYTLLDRSAEAELISRCMQRNTSLVIGGVFNSGILATGAGPDAYFDYEPASSDIVRRVNGLQALAAEYGTPLAAAALQFPLRSPVVASVLIGTAKAASLLKNLELLSTKVPEEFFIRAERFTLR